MPLKYFIPDWEDRLDASFDFQADAFSRPRAEARARDVYAHQLFDPPPYDGLMVSLASLGKRYLSGSGGTISLDGCHSIHEYFRTAACSRRLVIMGDCGAFEYANEDAPPERFSTARVATMYSALKVDFGVSVDHMVVDQIRVRQKDGSFERRRLSDKEKEARRQLSVENALEFLRYHRKRRLQFVPVGAAQGSEVESYEESVRRLEECGYDYIGLGALVPRSNEEIVRIVQQVDASLSRLGRGRRQDVKLHLFGICRPRCLAEFRRYGVTSFDSASFLRKAWLRSGMNYLTAAKDWYAAIRVPYSSNAQVKRNARRDGIGSEGLSRMEARCLDLLRRYDAESVGLRTVLDAVVEYDELLLRDYDGHQHREKYRRTLRDRPWKNCSCPVCKALGVEVVIFRGANRNKRRGFHNTFILYNSILNA